jgi:hypothetical protein
MINSIRILTFASALLQATVSTALSDETVTLTWKKSASEAQNNKTGILTLGEGESAKGVWAAGGGIDPWSNRNLYGSYGVRISVMKDEETWITSPLGVATQYDGGGFEKLNFEIAGPAVIRLNPMGDSATYATFSVKRVGTASPPAEVPQEAGSNFDVILEQSSDLVNWTPANPGAYSGTETKRFFRTRIVKKQ